MAVALEIFARAMLQAKHCVCKEMKCKIEISVIKREESQARKGFLAMKAYRCESTWVAPASYVVKVKVKVIVVACRSRSKSRRNWLI